MIYMSQLVPLDDRLLELYIHAISNKQIQLDLRVLRAYSIVEDIPPKTSANQRAGMRRRSVDLFPVI
jgi:hypothetical protein